MHEAPSGTQLSPSLPSLARPSREEGRTAEQNSWAGPVESSAPPLRSPPKDAEFAETAEDGDPKAEDPGTGAEARSMDSAWVRYCVEYRDLIRGETLFQCYTDTDSTFLQHSTDGPAFEVRISYGARVLEKGSKEPPPKPGLAPPGATAPPSHIYPVSTPAYYLRIYSRAIIHALQSVVQYYPGADLSGDILTVRWPYPILVHHYEELTRFRDRCATTRQDELCMRERDAAEHLRLLLAYLDEKIMPDVNAERERSKRGYATFAWSWVAYKPGTTLLNETIESRDGHAYVVHSVSGGTFTSPPTDWYIRGWKLMYDGRHMVRVPYNQVSVKFGGEARNNGQYFDLNATFETEEVKELIGYGKQYWKLLRKQCMYYKGSCREFPHNHVDGLVMADLKAFYAENRLSIPKCLDQSDFRKSSSDCVCPVCMDRGRGSSSQTVASLFEDYERITLERSGELTDHQYLMCPMEIRAFVFRTRTWELLHVKDFRPPDFDSRIIDSLVMDERRVRTLKALAKSYARVDRDGKDMQREPWAADFIKGKGNGLIFLLHGKPGVGKTCTAECIAEFTGRPLMVLTCSDIGTDPGVVEASLTESFKKARSWGAVLLIDEADVFMERRGPADLQRNSLVAGFLRALEFYDGILFLTTNRVGAFDDAFISRVHVQLYYPDFTDDQRQRIWQTFLDKLARERGDYMRIKMDAKDYIYGSAIRALKWNGREIRNAFQTAVSLAEYESTKDEEGRIVLTDDHLRAVVELSKDFKDYLHELHKGDEGKRAERRNDRLDR